MERKPSPGPLSQRPFVKIAARRSELPKRPVTPTQAAKERKPGPAEDESSLFLREAAGAKPLPPGPHPTYVPPINAPLPDPTAEDKAVREELRALVHGQKRFVLSDTHEFIEGAVEDLDRRIRLKLRRGDFAVQGHLDLHGFNRKEARSALQSFVYKKHLAGKRCVLVIHGKGRNSKDGQPVLKELMGRWLSRGELGRTVLAYCTAQPADGGAGAIYVLLRR
jgi:DNA-nicking Smr family endonuclease